ncbi:PIN-like domain-containing protein [Mycobacteroides abscessus subsp. abscessus]|uniref:PIN-like domain-containing protein n=1 Tax=Mycobacteroides abscessus TaxID=36809 RepID=UPI0039EECD13
MVREEFSEWYHLNDNAIAQVVREGTIALDANVLLDLYRVGADRRAEIIEALHTIGDRLFVPYQAAYEYQKNRLSTIADTQTKFDKTLKSIKDACGNALESALVEIRDKAVRAAIEQAFKDSFSSFEDKHARLRSGHILPLSETRREDPVRNELEKLLCGSSLGKRPTDIELEARRKDATTRINERRPPGFGDKDKDEATGDCLIWAELLEHAKAIDRPIMFVTNDVKKGDWYSVVNGGIMGPRPELVTEMAVAAPNHYYHQGTLDNLLWLAKKILGVKIRTETIETVRDLAPELTARLSFTQALATARSLLDPTQPVSASDRILLDSAIRSLQKAEDNPVDNAVATLNALRHHTLVSADEFFEAQLKTLKEGTDKDDQH